MSSHLSLQLLSANQLKLVTTTHHVQTGIGTKSFDHSQFYFKGAYLQHPITFHPRALILSFYPFILSLLIHPFIFILSISSLQIHPQLFVLHLVILSKSSAICHTLRIHPLLNEIYFFIHSI